MFESATFHSRNAIPNQTAQWMLFALALNLSLVAAFVVAPLIYPDGLPNRLLQRALYAPPLIPAPPASPHLMPSAASAQPVLANPYQAPRITPTRISTEPVPASNPIIGGDAVGGGAVPGATSQDAAIFHSNPPVVVHPAPPEPMSISTGVAEGLILSKTTPIYPPIARAMRLSGTVTLAATISPQGLIENPRVLSGHPILAQAAIDAVRVWRYRPYRLNGQPVEVETTITVVFSWMGR